MKPHTVLNKRVKDARVPVLRVPVLLASGTLWTRSTQSFWPSRYPEDWRDSVLLAPQVTCGAGLSPFAPPGTLWTVGTQSFQPPQVPYELVGLSPFGHQVTLGLEDMAGHAYQEIYFV